MSEKLAIYDEEKTIAGLKSVNGEIDITVAKFRELMGVVNQASQGFARATPREFVQAAERSRVATEGMTVVTNQLSDAERRLLQVERQLAIAQSTLAPQIANVAAQTRLLNTEQRNRALAEERLAALSDRERARLGNTLQIYNSVQQKLVRLQSEYRNLATAKQLGMTLTDREIARMAELERRIQRYDQTLKAVDGSMGIYRRNVGNYASGFNSMNNSVAQLAREAPAFTYSMQTGFMAISNNLPIFFDSMKSAREENVRLRAEGKATVPVWKQLGAAIFSWNTLLSIGITLLTVYGKEIGTWIQKMLKGSDATSILTKNTKDLNESRKEAVKSAASEISKLDTLYKVATNENAAKEARIRSVNKLQALYPSFFKNLSDEAIMVGKAKDQYISLRGAILDSARARAIGNILEKRVEEQLLQEEEVQRRLNIEKQNYIKIQKQGTQTEYVRDGQGGLILKEVEASELLNRSLNIQLGYNTQLNKIREKGIKTNKTLIEDKMKLDNKKDVLNYEGDKLGKGGNIPTEKKYSGAKLTGEQKDYLATLQAEKDNAIAIQNQKRLDLEINEEEYWRNYIQIVKNYRSKLDNYLDGSNAKEKQIEASVRKRAVDELVSANKEIYDIEKKNIEENSKIKVNELERNSKAIQENQYLNDLDKLNQQIEIDNQIISELSDYYEKQITLATTAGQSVIEWERKRDEEIGKIQDNRLKRVNAIPEALNVEIEYQSNLLKLSKDISYEKQRQLITTDKRLNLDQKDYLLTVLERQNQINVNNLEIDRLKSLRGQILARIELAKLNGGLGIPTPEELQRLHEYEATIQRLSGENIEIDLGIASTLSPEMAKTKEIISKGLADLGLENLGNQFDAVFQKIIDGTFSAKDAALIAASTIADGLTAITNKTKDNTIAALDEQLKYTQETTEQEIGFINERLEQLNSLETLTEEQMHQRNQLEDEARTYKEQQMQREKMIEAQKARAEQKAAANQALINGALAATMTLAQMGFIAGAIPAGLALAFGIAQSIAISSKDVVPKYRVGRRGGKAEVAITQDGGREFITNEKGEITSLGSDKGDQLTYLKKGDNVHTAKETKAIISRMGSMPKLGDNILQKIALQSLRAPAPVVINQTQDNSDAIADKVGRKFENALKKYDKPVVIKNGGKILLYRGANLGLQIGEYDENGNEKYYS